MMFARGSGGGGRHVLRQASAGGSSKILAIRLAHAESASPLARRDVLTAATFPGGRSLWSDSLATSEHWDHEYNYGLRAIQFSAEAIANYQFQLSECQARLKDGTLVVLNPGRELDRVDLRDSLADGAVHKVDLTAAFEKRQHRPRLPGGAEAQTGQRQRPGRRMSPATIASPPNAGRARRMWRSQDQKLNFAI